jgi:CRISPR-associated protein Cas1
MTEAIRHSPAHADADLLPARMLNELVYCERLFYLEHVQGLFVESADTIEGSAQHARDAKRGKQRAYSGVKRGKTTTKAGSVGDAAKGAESAEDSPGVAGDAADPDTPAALWGSLPRSLVLRSERLGVVGSIDVLEHGDEGVVVVEAKRGRAPLDRDHRWRDHELPYGAWPADVMQVGVYLALVRDAGLDCELAQVLYREDRRRVDVPWSAALERFVLEGMALARTVEAAPTPPEPLLDSPKCIRCSLHGICLPDEHHALKALERPSEVRRIIPGRDDAAVLHVITPGAIVGKDGEALTVRTPDGAATRVLSKDVAHVALFGGTTVTRPCLDHLMREGIAISFLSGAGRTLGYAAPIATRNIVLRQAQFRGADAPDTRLRIARALVLAKIANQRTLLRRYRTRGYREFEEEDGTALPDWADPGDAPEDRPDAPMPAAMELHEALRRMKVAGDAAGRATNVDAVRGHEGDAAACYFSAMPRLLPPAWRAHMVGRSRRPPLDRVNSLLSFFYALLVKDAVAACARIGLDPMLGFLHTVRAGRPALALDLVEPFRPAWADASVLRLIATSGIQLKDFHVSSAGVHLTDRGRRVAIQAYERRADELTTHPTFGYRMSYRRLLELEARLLGKVLLGELDHYTPLRTR